MKITVRRAKPKDAIVLALLGRITFSEAFAYRFTDQQDLQDYLNHTFSAKKLKHSVLKENNAFWVAYAQGFPVGYAKLKLCKFHESVPGETPAQLQKIYVLKDFHGTEAGRKLMAAMLQTCREQATDYLWLTVLSTNIRAVRFYLKNNFYTADHPTFTIGSQTFEYNLMVKSLL